MRQVCFENFDFLVKVKGPLGQSIFFSLFFFFFFQAVRTGSGFQVGSGQTLVGGDVMDDVTSLDSYGTCAHVARGHEL